VAVYGVRWRFHLALGSIAWMRYASGNSFELFGMELSAAKWMLFAVGLLIVLYVMFAWWRDTIKEAHEGHHTRVVSLHLRYGMILFIASEVMFFVAWFWAYFDAALFAGEASTLRALKQRVASGRRKASRPLIPGTCRCSTR
jgi:cytochrome c oxidase subunit 3